MRGEAWPSPTKGVFLTGDTGVKAAGPELGGYFGQAGWAQGAGRGQQGPGQLPECRSPAAAGILGPVERSAAAAQILHGCFILSKILG